MSSYQPKTLFHLPKHFDSPITVGRLNELSKYPREVTRSTGNCDNFGIQNC